MHQINFEVHSIHTLNNVSAINHSRCTSTVKNTVPMNVSACCVCVYVPRGEHFSLLSLSACGPQSAQKSKIVSSFLIFGMS